MILWVKMFDFFSATSSPSCPEKGRNKEASVQFGKTPSPEGRVRAIIWLLLFVIDNGGRDSGGYGGGFR